YLGRKQPKTAENLCLDFGCREGKEFCKGLGLCRLLPPIAPSPNPAAHRRSPHAFAVQRVCATIVD
ncbi:TPA: hypothetical protein ACJMBJ_002060, partial [Neisseria meningitidis]